MPDGDIRTGAIAQLLAEGRALTHVSPRSRPDNPVVWSRTQAFGPVVVGAMGETDGEITLAQMPANTILTTLDGSARCNCHLDDRWSLRDAMPGDVALMPEGARLYSTWQNRTEVQTYNLVEFRNDALALYVPEASGDRIARGHLLPDGFAQRPVLAGLSRALAREIDPALRRGRLFAETAIRLLFLELLATSWSVKCEPPAGRGADRRILRAKDYIEANFTRDISLLEIAGAAGLSPTQLTRAFRAAEGTTPYAYVIDRRLAFAARLLQSTQTPIAQIAIEAGFSDQPHLTRAIRARYGRTPNDIRRA
jgi:AraC family transcriptional regulator